MPSSSAFFRAARLAGSSTRASALDTLGYMLVSIGVVKNIIPGSRSFHFEAVANEPRPTDEPDIAGGQAFHDFDDHYMESYGSIHAI